MSSAHNKVPGLSVSSYGLTSGRIWFQAPESPKSQSLILGARLGCTWSDRNPGSAITGRGASCVSRDLAEPHRGAGVGAFLPEEVTQPGFQSLYNECFQVQSSESLLSCTHSHKHCCSHGHGRRPSCSQQPRPQTEGAPHPGRPPALGESPGNEEPRPLPLPRPDPCPKLHAGSIPSR